jgi:DNA-directed RNA polymerase specialized sigma24 family protein
MALTTDADGAWVAWWPEASGSVARGLARRFGPEHAEDALQIVAVKLAAGADHPETDGPVRAWVRTSATRAALDEVRRLSRIDASADHPPERTAVDDPEREALARALLDATFSAIGRMAGRDRALLLHAPSAEVDAMKPGARDTARSRARALLRNAVGPVFGVGAVVARSLRRVLVSPQGVAVALAPAAVAVVFLAFDSSPAFHAAFGSSEPAVLASPAASRSGSVAGSASRSASSSAAGLRRQSAAVRVAMSSASSSSASRTASGGTGRSTTIAHAGAGPAAVDVGHYQPPPDAKPPLMCFVNLPTTPSSICVQHPAR